MANESRSQVASTAATTEVASALSLPVKAAGQVGFRDAPRTRYRVSGSRVKLTDARAASQMLREVQAGRMPLRVTPRGFRIPWVFADPL